MPMIDVRRPAVIALSAEERAAVAEAIAYRLAECASNARLHELAENEPAAARWWAKRAALDAAAAKVGRIERRYGEASNPCQSKSSNP